MSRGRTAKPHREGGHVDPSPSVVHRLTYESGGDILGQVLSHLPDWRDLASARSVCRDWRRAASRDDVWLPHCERVFFQPVPDYPTRVIRWDVGAVPAHAKALHRRGFHRLAFQETVANRTRTWLTRDELVSLRWSFRFKEISGMGDPFEDPRGGGCWMENVILADGTCHLEPDGGGASQAAHRWAFASDIYDETAVEIKHDERGARRDGAGNELRGERRAAATRLYLRRLLEARRHPSHPCGSRMFPSDAEDLDRRRDPIHDTKIQMRTDNSRGGSKSPRVPGWHSDPPGFSVGSVVKVWPEEQPPRVTGSRGERVLSTYPGAVVWRSARTWGWVMESCWTIAASWGMPKREEVIAFRRAQKARLTPKLDRFPFRDELQENRVRHETQAREVAAYHRAVMGQSLAVYPEGHYPSHGFPSIEAAFGAKPGVEFCDPAHVEATQAPTEVRVYVGTTRDSGGREPSFVATLPAAHAHWVCSKPWNAGKMETDATRLAAYDPEWAETPEAKAIYDIP